MIAERGGEGRSELEGARELGMETIFVGHLFNGL